MKVKNAPSAYSAERFMRIFIYEVILLTASAFRVN